MYLIKNLITENIWFKYYNFIIEVDKGNHENYDSDDEKERENVLKSITLKFFDVIPMILSLIFFKFLGK